MTRDRFEWLSYGLAIGLLLGWLAGATLMLSYRHDAAPVAARVIALPGPTLNDMCPQRPPRVWLPFRTPRHVHAVPQCGEPTISRNQAAPAPSDAGITAPMARGSLPNSLAAYSAPAGPNLEEPPPGIWPVPFTDYPGADASPPKHCRKHHKCKPVTVSFGQAPMGLLVALFGGAAWAGFRRRTL